MRQERNEPLIPAGQELKGIREWEDLYDELDELKKIFYEFMKRWTEQTSLEMDANRPVLYERHEDYKVYSLNKDRLMKEKSFLDKIAKQIQNGNEEFKHANTLD